MIQRTEHIHQLILIDHVDKTYRDICQVRYLIDTRDMITFILRIIQI